MGRPPNPKTGRVTLDLDPKLKLRASIAALREGVTLTELIEAALRSYLKEKAI